MIAGNELSYLQQIQGGQQIDEETYGKSNANQRFTWFGVLRTLIIEHSNLWFIRV